MTTTAPRTTAHRHSHETEEAPPGPSEGAVVINIGEHVGAAVIYTEQAWDGYELEIRPLGGAWTGTHTAVRERKVGHDVLFAAVFGSLHEGAWEVRVCGSGAPDGDLVLLVTGAHVVEARWPRAAP